MGILFLAAIIATVGFGIVGLVKTFNIDPEKVVNFMFRLEDEYNYNND